MPDHVHAVIWFPQLGQLRVFVQQWKRPSSHHIGRWMREELSGYAEQTQPDDPFWQAKFYSFNLFNAEKIREKLTYMHENPVRAGLVTRPCDWPFNSARWYEERWYEERRSVGVPVRWIE